jgi:cell wall-associated NlpC family hydrolase
MAGVGDRQAGATSGSPAAVAVNFALRQLGKPYRWGAGSRAATNRDAALLAAMRRAYATLEPIRIKAGPG